MIRVIISKYVTCRRLREKVAEQFMADLLNNRVQEEPPFRYCRMDIMFNSFYIRNVELL